jgi:hypothetical protein
VAVGAAAGPVRGVYIWLASRFDWVCLTHNPTLTQTHSKSGQPFEYVRALYVALWSEASPLGKEAIWAVYQELRRMAPELAAEAGTALYLPMTGCNDRVEGFGSLRAQRHVRHFVLRGGIEEGRVGVDDLE